MVVVGKSQEGPDFHFGMGNRPLPQGLYFLLIHSNSVLGHYMAKVHNLPFEELTFLWLKFKPHLSQISENCPQLPQVFLWDCSKDNYVI